MTFTAVVVIHDSEPELRALLDSLARQLPEPPQLVVVDTGSRDRGAALARERGAEVASLPDNPGFGPATNAGVERADHPGEGGFGLVGGHPDGVGEQFAFLVEQSGVGSDLSQGQVAGGLPGLGGGLFEVLTGGAQRPGGCLVDGGACAGAGLAGPGLYSGIVGP